MASPTGSEKSRRLTATLVSIVVFFLVLVTPSELLHLCYYVVDHDNAPSFELALVVANVLQTANFALNFILYCACNSSHVFPSYSAPNGVRSRQVLPGVTKLRL